MANKITTRPSELTLMHNYNLRNQGWPREFTSTHKENGSRVNEVDPVTFTKEIINVYPSNADIIYAAKLTTANRHIGVGSYSPFELRKGVFGNTPAGKGHYILPAFDRNRSLISGIEGLYDSTKDKDRFRPVSVEFFAGRVFYLMPDGKVLYSQIIEQRDVRKAERCYQDADPTAEDINELVATDGGVIVIQEVGEAVQLTSTGSELLLFADNGVWSIGGTEQSNFRATDFRTRRVTNIGVTGQDTIVTAEGNVVYWGRGGIYILAPDEISGELGAQNLSEQTIQTSYNNILPAARLHAKGFYDERERKVLWMYNDTAEYDGEKFKNRYNRILFFDTLLGSFYTYTVDLSGSLPYMTSVLQKEATGTKVVDRNVILITDFRIGDFVTTWDTTLAGGNNTVILPFTADGTYNCTVHWGDGATEVVTTSGIRSHEYDSPGVYTVSISGVCTDWSMTRTGSATSTAQRLISVDQWGSIAWGSTLEGFMAGTVNMQINAIDAPDFSSVTDLTTAFNNCGSTTMLDADYSNIQILNSTWRGTNFTDIPTGLNFNNVTTANATWKDSAVMGNMIVSFPAATSLESVFEATGISGVNVSATTTPGVNFHRFAAFCPALTSFNGTFGLLASPGGFSISFAGPRNTGHMLYKSPQVSSAIANGHDGWFSLADKNLSAASINSFFHSLVDPVRTTSDSIQKMIWIGGNPGTSAADETIATAKGYFVDKIASEDD